MRLPKFNAFLREQELSDGFKMGIGLNTGMVVSGNVGSERRMEYTAIGDTTNTASRLQGMTKGQSHLLFFADTTRERLQRELDDIVFIDEFEVRGRQQPVKIWSIEDASDAAFEERKSLGYPGRLGQVALAGPDVDVLPRAEVPDADDAAQDASERAVAPVLDEPLRAAHRGRAVAPARLEAPLAVAPQRSAPAAFVSLRRSTC